jgi:hypothetical protein
MRKLSVQVGQCSTTDADGTTECNAMCGRNSIYHTCIGGCMYLDSVLYRGVRSGSKRAKKTTIISSVVKQK